VSAGQKKGLEIRSDMSIFYPVQASLSPAEQAGEIGRLLSKQRKSLRLTQEAAAHESGISLSMLRRAESRGCIPLPQLLKLANTIGCQLHLYSKPKDPGSDSLKTSLNQRHPGLVWSNSKASQEIYIRKALLNPRFGQLLKLAKEFGLKALKDEWTNLAAQFPGEAQRVEMEVVRILRNMESGGVSAK